jgi:ubiquinone/menaquinone biosynthesis C-methylase UbiE
MRVDGHEDYSDSRAMKISTRYDALNALLFLPSGGSRHLRRKLVDALHVTAGARVLELGCGTGQVTAELSRRGAEVVAVDALAEMLSAARRRAPRARFVHGDLRTSAVAGHFDHVVFSFVLHNLGHSDRVSVLRRAASSIGKAGRIGILEWALPGRHRKAALWRKALLYIEPSPNVAEILSGALHQELESVGLRTLNRTDVAGGRAQLIIAGPSSHTQS